MENLPIEIKRLLEIIRKVNYGEIRVIIQAGKPVRIEAGIRQIKLDTPEDFKTGLESIDL